MRDKLEYPKSLHMRFEDRHKQKVLESIKNLPVENRSKGSKIILKRWGYSTFAAIVIFLMLIGSTHVSLAMAKVTAKIPYFSYFIKQKEYREAIHGVIFKVINENNYEFSNLDVSVPDREIKIWLLGPNEDVRSMKAEVIETINSELVAQNFGKYDIEVKKGKVRKPMESTPEIDEYIRQSFELEEKLIDMLEKNNYHPAFPVQVRINSKEKFIYVALPKTEKRVAELKEQLNLLTKDYGKFKYKITSIDMAAREQELRWVQNGIIDIIFDGLLENKAFKIEGLSYSFHPLPLQIGVRIALKSTDPEAKEIAETIEKDIAEFIQTHEMTANVRNDPYEVTVYGKDEKKINNE
ncbi:DUF4030 domain-containing protein [Neobacillus niacini]|uniref:DUF4030 domain-containing protein n=1 Tax=Neobacillus niacini TaxID=86668 RepID=UPI00052FB5EE|nr:DUF4030 domain-containing protein [Neobacillus niacini]KGM44791.1 hypothetical protein NP83_09455 [Neobacillus niacini]MEC1522610.1 DUF4030 domain-containing protein [Neobacillus niacini]